MLHTEIHSSINTVVFASASKDSVIKIFDGVSGELKMVMSGHHGAVRNVAISDVRRQFATGGNTGILSVWGSHSGVEKCALNDLEDTVINAVGFSCDGSWLAAAGEDARVALYGYKREGGRDGVWEFVGFLQQNKMISSLAWHPKDPDVLLTGEGGQAMKMTTGAVVATLAIAEDDDLEAKQLIKKGGKLGGRNGIVWNVRSQKPKAIMQGHDSTNDCLCGQDVDCPLLGHRGDVLSVAWSPDGEKAATASRDCTVRLWSERGEALWCTRELSAGVNAVSISPDGLRVASAGDDMKITLWAIENGAKQLTLSGHDGWIYCLSWSPNSCVLVSGSRDKTVRLWDVTTDESLQHSLRLHEQIQRARPDQEAQSLNHEHPSESPSESAPAADASESASDDNNQDEDKDQNESDKDLDSPSGNLFRFGKRAFGNVTSKITSLQHKLQVAVGDTFEKVTDTLEILEQLEGVAESAQQKLNFAKATALRAAQAAADTVSSALENIENTAEVAMTNAVSKMDDFKCKIPQKSARD